MLVREMAEGNGENSASERDSAPDGEAQYRMACSLLQRGHLDEARRLYRQITMRETSPRLMARIHNDLGVIASVRGDLATARQAFQKALESNAQNQSARDNLRLLDDQEAASLESGTSVDSPVAAASARPGAGRIAILSFLFNWPSPGGGIVHTVELAQFLLRAGYEVQHFYARYPQWGVGNVERPPDFPSQALDFDASSWNLPTIKQKYREAVDRFDPDHVIITDSWNIKPHLADAVRGYPYILRFQAMECICPLNNVRLLMDDGGRARQCALHQLANPKQCVECVSKRAHMSGPLHQTERALSEVGTPAYHELLLRAFGEAEAVLVVNPLHEAMLSPYTTQVRVVTAGMDPARFPWPRPTRQNNGKVVLFFAGLINEFMKGYHVVQEACAMLWQRRQDFELVATGDPVCQANAFTRFVGWQSQEELPKQLQAADVLVIPTVAQEALGRTAVEAMATGIPVIASDIGGLPFTVANGATGLLCRPGDTEDLASKIECLLDDSELRQRMGQAGRKRFEEHYAWPVIIERHYRPLLANRRLASANRPER
jgi:glycosyltransferase involved in cell wall biosynthesis